jgi:hypothetical protein
MAKLCTETVYCEPERGSKDGSITIKFDINVNQNGDFTTTLPRDIVEQLENAQIKVDTNRIGNKGFLSSNTKDGLIKEVSNLAREYVSRELIAETLIIKYSIETQMSYQISIDGKVCPNGSFGGGTGWKRGTKETSATYPAPFGLKVYVGVFTKREWLYKSGVKKETLESHWGSRGITKTEEEAPYLHWISNLTTISPKDSFGSMEVNEMEYTEQAAKFFVDLVSSICLLNEKILPIIKEKSTLLDFINSNRKLIG